MTAFEKKVVLVTGAAQGIGRAIAERFLSLDANLAAIDSNVARLEKSFGERGSHSANVIPLGCDITRKSEIQEVVDAILKQWGRIDVLINNAGIIRDHLISEMSEEDWDRVLEVNLKGAFLLVQAVLPSMKAQKGGKIVNISSRSWLGNKGQANYSSSKAGLIGLTRSLALELARFKINVNAVAPGLIDTPMTRGMRKEILEKLLRMQPTGEMGQPEDIAAAVTFLSSDEARFITGQVLHVDGGKSCGVLSL